MQIYWLPLGSSAFSLAKECNGLVASIMIIRSLMQYAWDTNFKGANSSKPTVPIQRHNQWVKKISHKLGNESCSYTSIRRSSENYGSQSVPSQVSTEPSGPGLRRFKSSPTNS